MKIKISICILLLWCITLLVNAQILDEVLGKGSTTLYPMYMNEILANPSNSIMQIGRNHQVVGGTQVVSEAILNLN